MLSLITIHLLAFLHPFFVNVTEIKHNAKEKRIEISTRMFFDDFEHALEKKYNVPIDILRADHKQTDPLIADYVKKHLRLVADGRALNMNYLGYEIEEDACWCYFEAAKISKVRQLQVTNDILFDEHKTQVNILQVSMNGRESNIQLNNPESRAVFK